MPVIEIKQQWVDELAELQQNSAVLPLHDVVERALQQYLFRQRQEKIARERRWYEAHHQEVVQQYRGQYVAIHNGQIVDTDQDGRTLSKRIRQHYGRTAIALIQVADTAEPPALYVYSPKLIQAS